MKSVLYITANPKREEESNSLRVGRHLIETIQALHEDSKIEEIHVYQQTVPLIDGTFLKARDQLASGKDFHELLPDEQDIVRKVHRQTDQFIAADVYVFAYPLWNFGVPPMLKAYVDTIKIARKTFRYTPDGPIGLLSGKTAILIQSSGDVYSHGPLHEYEHGSCYLKSVLSFIGIDKIETVYMEGMDKDVEQRDIKRRQAFEQVDRIANNLSCQLYPCGADTAE
ncbi:NAD(P)H-dependent oxidoreductase [Brevibacillus choshinensis]|uniref:FMN-dependent NADH-azoreductase n=1 Tax=Brevibacillus choshinensis TaxID=54911 RepID=UPI002E1ECF0D|nr:NAD(P)H-dependent oxidoreductase [Brevibacillus choshinensis]MED4785278.1 NAD(P)H-dependent oxidoreductase [Brevibacillus choshinensis]